MIRGKMDIAGNSSAKLRSFLTNRCTNNKATTEDRIYGEISLVPPWNQENARPKKTAASETDCARKKTRLNTTTPNVSTWENPVHKNWNNRLSLKEANGFQIV